MNLKYAINTILDLPEDALCRVVGYLSEYANKVQTLNTVQRQTSLNKSLLFSYVAGYEKQNKDES